MIKNIERVLAYNVGRELSQSELELVAGAGGQSTTTIGDGAMCDDDDGNEQDCKVG